MVLDRILKFKKHLQTSSVEKEKGTYTSLVLKANLKLDCFDIIIKEWGVTYKYVDAISQ